ncbi:MAG: hypothetical protein ACLVB5_14120 [Christensenellales bacterium]
MERHQRRHQMAKLNAEGRCGGSARREPEPGYQLAKVALAQSGLTLRCVVPRMGKRATARRLPISAVLSADILAAPDQRDGNPARAVDASGPVRARARPDRAALPGRRRKDD